jgi:hypothetical protein
MIQAMRKAIARQLEAAHNILRVVGMIPNVKHATVISRANMIKQMERIILYIWFKYYFVY